MDGFSLNNEFVQVIRFMRHGGRRIKRIGRLQEERQDRMIIGSGTIRMESTRSYAAQSKQKSAVVVGKNDLQNGGSEATLRSSSETSGSRFEGKTFFTQMLKAGTDDEVTAEMEQSLLGKRGQLSIEKVESYQDRASMKTIREQSLFYLLRHLHQMFRHRGGMRELQELQNGVVYQSSGNVTPIAVMENSYSYEEAEETTFTTQGKVVTADGREISFDLSLDMSRKFREYYYEREEIYATQNENASFIDPLVINLDSSIANVSDQKFMFDIDSDGILDSISGLNSGSGYLALDKNGDGIINDGSELFGTATGDGFADLAAYDDDGNGWIDENDEIWSKLLIWTKDENGKDMLYHLKDKGVGAICLEKVDTDFSLKSLKDNAMNGKIRKTGIFLYENGNVGTMQHLDLAR